MSSLAFVSTKLNRFANHRADAAWIEHQKSAQGAKFIQFYGDSVRMKEGQLYLGCPDENHDLVFLGCDEAQSPWFAFHHNSEGEMSPLRPLAVNQVLPDEVLSILAQARSLLHWHAHNSFCASCGTKSQMQDAGYRRHCPSCGDDTFPRTDAVVIMAVIHENKVLLGRQKAWAPGMFSALAGFMEPGETIEHAVAREVQEETGVVVGEVTYVTSQPWPFPMNLMIGCIAKAKQSEITIDEKELETARWFGLEELRLMLDHKHPESLYASNPYAIAHHVIEAACQVIEKQI